RDDSGAPRAARSCVFSHDKGSLPEIPGEQPHPLVREADTRLVTLAPFGHDELADRVRAPPGERAVSRVVEGDVVELVVRPHFPQQVDAAAGHRELVSHAAVVTVDTHRRYARLFETFEGGCEARVDEGTLDVERVELAQLALRLGMRDLRIGDKVGHDLTPFLWRDWFWSSPSRWLPPAAGAFFC